ncbi:unnamed protein product [Moneuplotes crassus]|uniref:Uncharacterized protein n=1 Tax=Euplotes crassus TaxID=5936 RepID=A0AAD1XWS2_EUPCR|nr:unnamed protein product [Moneuplotes crassus]
MDVFSIGYKLIFLINLITYCLSATCPDGSYDNSGSCAQCHSSCATCSNGTECLTCDEQILNPSTKLCEPCPEGEYFDTPRQLCQSCGSSCLDKCAYQTSCFDCPAGQALNLSSMTCVTSCESNQTKIEDVQFRSIAFCRDNQYYVDPSSAEIIELGIKNYPYKSIGLVFVELLNIRSHSENEVIIYIKENTVIDIEKGYNYIANITSVKIESYSSSGTPGRATLYVKQNEVNMFNSKTSFNLVNSRTLNLLSKINVTGVSSAEISILQSTDTCIFVWRSNFTMSNINIQGDISNDAKTSSYFLRPVYLQQRIIIFHNMDIQLTGYLLRTTDPMSMDLLNIYVDFHAMMGGFWMNINCNYPDAYTEGKITSKNLTAVNSVDRVAPFRIPFIVTSGPEDIYFEDSNIQVWDSLSEDRAVIETTVTSDCIPTDTKNNTFTFVRTKMSMADNPGEDKFATYYIDLVQNVHRKLIFNYISNEFTNQYKMPYPMNTTFTNVTTANGGLMVTLIKSILIQNVIYQDCDDFAFATINLLDADTVSITNLTHQNVNGTGTSSQRYIRIKMNPQGTISLSSTNFHSCSLFQKPGIFLEGSVSTFSLQNSAFTSLSLGASNSLLSLQEISTLFITNCSFSSITSEVLNPEFIINIQKLQLTGLQDSAISDLAVTGIKVPFLEIGSLTGTLEAERLVMMKNLVFRDCALPVSMDLVRFGNMESSEKVKFRFDNLVFENISFPTEGNLVKLQHQLVEQVEIVDSSFSGVSGASVHIEAANKKTEVLNAGLYTKVKFLRCNFTQIDANIGSAIEVFEGARVVIEDSTFQNVYTLEEGAVLFAGRREAEVVIRNSTFREIYALTGGVFNIESSSVVKVYDSTFSNNFAVVACVVYAVNFGSFELYNITATLNYAVSNPFALIFDAPSTSIISNSTIYDNQALAPAKVKSEITIACSSLCFLSSKFKAYLLAHPELYFITSSSYMIQVIIGALTIKDSTRFFHDAKILDLSESALTIENTDFYNCSNAHNMLKASTSRVSMRGVKFYDMVTSPASTTSLVRFAYECVLDINGVEYYNSTAQFISITSSEGIINGINIHDVTVSLEDPNPIVQLDENIGISISDWEFRNSSVRSDYLEMSHKTSISNMKNVNFTGINQSPIYFSECTIGTMKGITINACTRGIVFSLSSFSELSGSNFNDLGSNTIHFGGAIQMKDSNGTILNNEFALNTAESDGAIGISCSLSLVCKSSIMSNTFANNKAVKQGGAIHYDMFRPILRNNSFINNSAVYGSIISSYAVKIKQKGAQDGPLILSDIGSGIAYQNTLVLTLYDHDDQIYSLDSSSQIVISGNSSGTNVLGFKAVKATSGEATFTDLRFISSPGDKEVLFDIESPGLDLTRLKKFMGLITSKRKNYKFRYCKPGEQIINKTTCQICSPGSYSFIWNSTECSKCIQHTTCEGGDEMVLHSGYWRKNKNSTDLIECPNKDACKGGFSATNTFPVNCATGYDGLLCSQCISNDQTRYEQVDEFVCEKCPEPFLNALKVLGVFLAVFIFLCALIAMNIRKKDESQKSILMRILTNHLQVTSLTFAYNMKFPDILLELLSPLSRANSSTESVISFDCFASESQLKLFAPSIAILKVGLSALSPLLILLACLIFFSICHLLFPKHFTDFRRNMVISTVSVIYLLHPTITTSALGIFQCIEVGEGESRMRIDLSIGCYSEEHLTWACLLGIPMIAVWVISAPCLALTVLYKRRKTLNEPKTKRYLIVMYQGFQIKYYY